jgi:hypothetical protein
VWGGWVYRRKKGFIIEIAVPRGVRPQLIVTRTIHVDACSRTRPRRRRGGGGDDGGCDGGGCEGGWGRLDHGGGNGDNLRRSVGLGGGRGEGGRGGGDRGGDGGYKGGCDGISDLRNPNGDRGRGGDGNRG